MSDRRYFVYTAITCAHCGKHIYGRHTLRDSVMRAALARGARENGGQRSRHDWFCSRTCKMNHRLRHKP